MYIKQMGQKNKKNFLILKIIAFELIQQILSQSRTGYLSLAVNVLQNTPKI